LGDTKEKVLVLLLAGAATARHGAHG